MKTKCCFRDDIILIAITVYESWVNGSYDMLLFALKEFWWRFA